MGDLYSLPEAVRRQAEANLRPDERVEWAGTPSPSRVLLNSSVIWIFAIPWTAFAVAWETIALSVLFAGEIDGPGGGMWVWIFPLFGAPFVLIGICLLGAPFWAAHSARATGFVVTNQRLMELRAGSTEQSKFLSPEEIRGVEVRRHGRGTGSVKAICKPVRDRDGDRVYDDWALPGVLDADGAVAAIRRLIDMAGINPRSAVSIAR